VHCWKNVGKQRCAAGGLFSLKKCGKRPVTPWFAAFLVDSTKKYVRFALNQLFFFSEAKNFLIYPASCSGDPMYLY
jgi:hypothetical protein